MLGQIGKYPMTDLFSPFSLSGLSLRNRVVMAPMTRARAPKDEANELVALYYAQRATAGLIVSEGTPVSREGQGFVFNPGIFTEEQVAGWELVTNSVRALGGRMFAQLWHVGRISHPSIQANGKAPVSASSKIAAGATAFGYGDDGNVGLVPTPVPRPLETKEVGRVVRDFADAAINAINAGFDGVEIHGANGYLHEQFLNPLVNDRNDKYAADTIDNRLRFTLEVVDAVISRVGEKRVGIRLSPFGKLYDMPHYPEIEETYIKLAAELGARKISYIHIMDQSGFTNTSGTTEELVPAELHRMLLSFRKNLPETAIILAGGMNRVRANSLIADGVIDLAAFGQPFISNPDLVARLLNEWPLAPADRSTFYGGDAHGFVDYPPYTKPS